MRRGVACDADVSMEVLMLNIYEYSNVLRKRNAVLDSNSDLELYVTELLHQLGVPARLNGYHYLREAIMMLVDDMEIAHSITKVLYYDVAKKHNSSMNRVERAIRTAVGVSWERGNTEVFERIFGYSILSGKKKLCNSEYMVQIADRIRLDRMYGMNSLI